MKILHSSAPGVLALGAFLLTSTPGCVLMPPPVDESPAPCTQPCLSPTADPAASPSPDAETPQTETPQTETPTGCPSDCTGTTPPTGVSSCYESEPNDSPGKASPVSLDCRTYGELASDSTMVDWFALDIPDNFEGYRISLILEDSVGDCFTQVDPYLDVYNASGNQLLYHMEDSYEDYCPRLYLPVAPGDRYLLQAGTLWGTYGPYTLDILGSGPGTIDGFLSLGDSGGRAGRALASMAGNSSARTAAHTPRASRHSSDIPVVPGQVIVRPSQGATLESIRAHAGRAGLKVTDTRRLQGGRYGLFTLELPAGIPTGLVAKRNPESMAHTRALVETLRTVPGVASTDVNRVLDLHKVPNDPGYSEQWGYGSYPGMHLAPVWDETVGDSAVIVAVLDTGIDDEHPDLVANLLPGFDFISLLDNSGDGDGVDLDPFDILYKNHGTHVSGTIAAVSNNSKGVAGTSWKSRILPLRVCGEWGCTETDMSEAIFYAAGYETAGGPGQETARAEVLNMSIGGHDTCSVFMTDAILAASARNVTVVVSAGNESDYAADYTPASCPETLTVGASDRYGYLANFSNFGEALDIIAPGVDIYSTYMVDQGSYGWMQGTSMAAPHVSGMVALLKSINPTFSFATIQSILWDSAEPIECPYAGACDPGVVGGPAAMIEAQTLADQLEPIEQAYWVEAIEQGGEGRRVVTVTEGATFGLWRVPAGQWEVRAGKDINGDRSISDSERTHQADSPVTITANGEAIVDLFLKEVVSSGSNPLK